MGVPTSSLLRSCTHITFLTCCQQVILRFPFTSDPPFLDTLPPWSFLLLDKESMMDFSHTYNFLLTSHIRGQSIITLKILTCNISNNLVEIHHYRHT
jgi:hypothetical protein